MRGIRFQIQSKYQFQEKNVSLSTYQKPKNTGTIKISLKAFKYHMGERTLSMEVKNKNPKKHSPKTKQNKQTKNK